MAVIDRAIEEALTSPDLGSDPYPAYRRLLELEQPYWSDSWGVWLISGFDDVVGYFRDWEPFSAGRLGAQIEHLASAPALGW